MSSVLVVRHSRIGDALIPLPLLFALAKKYPQDTFTVLTNPRFEPLFKYMPSNVRYMPMLEKCTGFLRGVRYHIKRYFFTLKMGRLKFDKVAMLQYETFEKALSKKYAKRSLIVTCDEAEFRDENRLAKPDLGGLTMVGLYKSLLEKLGYVDLEPEYNSDEFKKNVPAELLNRLGIDAEKKLIGIAPFSKEKQKIYPLDKMREVATYLSLKGDTQTLIFGGGAAERSIVEAWGAANPQIISTIGKLSFLDELRLIARCDAFLSMDSANLHISSLLDTPVVSIWGATSPKGGYYTPKANACYKTMVKGEDCQPCSIFGAKPCSQKQQMKCLDISPQEVANAVEELIA